MGRTLGVMSDLMQAQAVVLTSLWGGARPSLCKGFPNDRGCNRF